MRHVDGQRLPTRCRSPPPRELRLPGKLIRVPYLTRPHRHRTGLTR